MNRIYYLLLAVFITTCQSPKDSKDLTADSLEIQDYELKREPVLFSPDDSLYKKVGEQVIIAGYVQTSGLDNIQNPAYKEFNSFQLISPKKDFFLKTNESLEKHWGKCVLIKGRFPEGWDLDTKEFNQTFTFNRSALIVDEINVVGDICKNTRWFKGYHLQQPDTILQGMLKRSYRPSPDIDYDYKIVLDKPVHLIYDDTMTTSELPVISNMPYSELEEALHAGKRLAFRGAITYGYAESMVFHLAEITGLEYER